MIEGPAIAKYGACVLLAAYSFVPMGRTRTCTGPGCQNGQCSRQATVVLRQIPVDAAPEFYTEVSGDRWVLVEEPIHQGEPEDLVSPAAETEEVKAEVEADATEEPAEGQDPTTENDAKAKADGGTGDAAKATTATATRKVWMRASDARAAGLIPTASSGGGGGFGSSGSGVAMAAPMAYEQVTYQRSYGCTGSGMQAFYGQPVYQQSAPTYRTRRVLFPNLFPRLRGLR